MTDRTLARPVTAGGVEYAAGTSEKDIPEENLKLITNPKAWDAEAAEARGNVASGPTQNFVQVQNPLPRATAAKSEDDEDPEAAPSPAKSAPAKAAAPKVTTRS